jgi:hypothetical protein
LSPAHENKVDIDTAKEHDYIVEKNPILNTSHSYQQNNSCSSQKCPQSSFSESSKTNYTRNSSTTRSWPVIHRNISQISPQQNNSSFFESNLSSSNTKTGHLQLKAEQQKRKSTHQYDFDQIFGINNSNYQQYLSTQKKSDLNFDCIRDKSPSFYDMQSHHNQDNSQQTQVGGFCNTPPIIIFLLITLIMTTSATSMLCAAFLTGKSIVKYI